MSNSPDDSPLLARAHRCIELAAEFGKLVGACEAELEGFAHDLREMITGSSEES